MRSVEWLMWNLFLDRFSYSEQHRARQQIVSITCGKKNVYSLDVELGLAFCSPVLRISDPPFFFNFQNFVLLLEGLAYGFSHFSTNLVRSTDCR